MSQTWSYLLLLFFAAAPTTSVEAFVASSSSLASTTSSSPLLLIQEKNRLEGSHGRGISSRRSSRSIRRSTSTSTQLHITWFPSYGMEEARSSFPLWLFGAAGSGGIARNSIPKLIDEWKEVQALKGVGTSLGGPTIGLNPMLAGYPEDLSIADLEQVVNNPLSIEQIVEKYPIEGNFLAAKGYLTLAAFEQANSKSYPLAVRAVFDSFIKPKAVEPYLAQSKIDDYKNDLNKIKDNLIRSKLFVYSAVAFLLLLLGLADVATATDAFRGWFPDWPGGIDFPTKLFTSEGNPFTIPDYIMMEIPPDRM